MVAISQAFHIPQVLKCNIITSIHQFNTHPKSQVSNFNLLLHPEQQQHICNSSTVAAQRPKAHQQQRSGQKHSITKIPSHKHGGHKFSVTKMSSRA